MTLAILSIGTALTMSLISGSLGNIRKVQLRARTIQNAETVLELSLLDESIKQPTTFTGDFQDGTRWTVRVDEVQMPSLESTEQGQQQLRQQAEFPLKVFSYTVEIMGPQSPAPDLRLQTLKLVSVRESGTTLGMPR